MVMDGVYLAMVGPKSTVQCLQVGAQAAKLHKHRREVCEPIPGFRQWGGALHTNGGAQRHRLECRLCGGRDTLHPLRDVTLQCGVALSMPSLMPGGM